MIILFWILIGCVGGTVVRAFLPRSEHVTYPTSLVLGLIGAFVGGMVGSLFVGGGPMTLRAGNLVPAALGSGITLTLYMANHRWRHALGLRDGRHAS